MADGKAATATEARCARAVVAAGLAEDAEAAHGRIRHRILDERSPLRIASGDLLVAKTEFFYYRHPNFGRDYVRILPRDGEYAFNWEREVVRKGPEFMCMALTLSERKKRELTAVENVEMLRQMDNNSVELKPGMFGISLDLFKLWRWISRKLR